MTDLQTIELADFRAGIFSDAGAAATATGLPSGRSSTPANGAATPENTWRCHADPRTGALVPLPARNAGPTQTLIPEGNARTAPAYYPAGQACAWLLDGVAFPADAVTGAVHVVGAYTFNYQPAGTGTGYATYLLTRMWLQATASTRDIAFERHSATGSGSGIQGGASLEKTRSIPNASSTYHPTLAQAYMLGLTTPKAGAISAADQALTTFDTDASANHVAQAARDPWLQLWPDVNTPTSNIPTNAFGDLLGFAPLLVGHQGRLVLLRNQSGSFGSGGNTAAAEYLHYTKVDRHGDGTSYTLVPGQESPSGYGAAHSLNANELFVVKHAGGGLLIRGDLDNPEVVRLPMIASTQSVHVRGAVTPLGFMYATRTGIYVWAGGDTSKRVSEQLDGWFWRHELDQSTETYYMQQRGRMTWWDPFVAVPGNWLFDTRGNGWWRLEPYGDPTVNTDAPMPMHCYDTSTAGTLYAFHYKLTSSWNVPFSYYLPQTKASNYSWQSQPLIETRDRTITPRQITLIAQPAAGASGAQTVKVTLTGIDSDGKIAATVAETFMLTDLGPDPVHQRRAVQGDGAGEMAGMRYVRVRIEAVAASGPAPKVMSVQIGYRESKMAPSR